MLHSDMGRCFKRCVRALLAFVALAGLALTSNRAHAQGRALSSSSGTFRLVTYNVAGLPEGLSQSRPSVNMPLISRLLNRYDVALVQEDFVYGRELRSAISHQYATAPFVRGNQLNFGDGLSQFSRIPFSGHVREAWARCNGVIDAFFDCLTPKGFSVARYLVSPGTSVDVYNVHLDAGDDPGDVRARAAQLEQLASAIERASNGRALVVGGDTNLNNEETPVYQKFLKRLGLKDSCQALHCPEPWRIDRISFRGGGGVRITAKSWQVDSHFVDAGGNQLSDHAPVAVEFRWSTQVPSTKSMATNEKRSPAAQSTRGAPGG